MPVPLPARLAAALLLAGTGAAAPARTGPPDGDERAPRPPNVVLIVVDDMHPRLLGFEGDPVARTPHLDRLAAEGTTFSRAYVPLPQCGPSRAALLVGRYPHETGSMTNPGRWRKTQPTVAQLLAARGYRTGFVGKWHLQKENKRQAGFESWAAIAREFKGYVDPILWIGEERRPFEGFMTDVLTDLAIEFVDAEREAEDPRPFFLWLAYKSPHQPWTPPDGERYDFDPADVRLPESLTDRLEEKPASQRETAPHEAFESGKRTLLREVVAEYYGMLVSLDDNVGRLLAHLEARGLTRDTLVVLLSDNGYLAGEHRMFSKGPLLYEELVRTPLVFHRPGTVPAGGRRTGLACTLDVLPTLVGLAGGEVPAEVDGVDLMPLVLGRVERVRDEVFLEYGRKLGESVPMLGVVTEEGKYVHYLDTDEEELYDHATDPFEVANLARVPEHAERLARLRERVARFRAGIEVPFW